MALHRHSYTYPVMVGTKPAAIGPAETCAAGHTRCYFPNDINVASLQEASGFTSFNEDSPGHIHTLMTGRQIVFNSYVPLDQYQGVCPLNHAWCRGSGDVIDYSWYKYSVNAVQENTSSGGSGTHRHTYIRASTYSLKLLQAVDCASGHSRCRCVASSDYTLVADPGGDITVYTSYALTLQLTVVTLSATEIGISSAKLNGELTAMTALESCLCGFEWGYSTSYGNTTPVVEKTSIGTFSHTITNLKADTEYHFRAFASYIVEGTTYTVYGEDKSFITRLTGSMASSSKSIITLEALRNIEMMRSGRFYIDESGKAVWESRFHRSA